MAQCVRLRVRQPYWTPDSTKDHRMKSVGLSRSDLALEVSPVACQAPDASAIGEVHDSRPKVVDKRIAELDGIRAIAIWMVLLSHIGYGFNDPPASLSLVPGSIRTIV